MAFQNKITSCTINKSKYCEFHKDYGHTTENCKTLQQIKNLRPRSNVGSMRPAGQWCCPQHNANKSMAGTINMIIEGTASFENLRNSNKNMPDLHPPSTSTHIILAPNGDDRIMFGKKDLQDGIEVQPSCKLGTKTMISRWIEWIIRYTRIETLNNIE
ncbi:Uncharacterized protein Adt_02659 [Abeliophyllum distichum]|uniref:Uncharacterized protein n=1 Tax=Abeliophyllum distichum TaxID=126358 RepID=A0ABD1VW93_9LAMI